MCSLRSTKQFLRPKYPPVHYIHTFRKILFSLSPSPSPSPFLSLSFCNFFSFSLHQNFWCWKSWWLTTQVLSQETSIFLLSQVDQIYRSVTGEMDTSRSKVVTPFFFDRAGVQPRNLHFFQRGKCSTINNIRVDSVVVLLSITPNLNQISTSNSWRTWFEHVWRFHKTLMVVGG